MVKSVTVPGKCYSISDGDRQDVGMLVVVLLLPLSLAMDNGEFDHGGGGGGGGGLVAVAASAAAAVDNDWRQKRLATRVLTVA